MNCMKTAAVLAVLFSSSALLSARSIESGNIDGIEYRIIADKAGNGAEAEILHPVFISMREEVFNEYGLTIPLRQTVTIACGAHLFREATGQSAVTAAVCFPERDEIVFQRVSALKRKGILEQTVRHEILHYAVTLARVRAGIPQKRAKELYWLEEAVCTSQSPAGLYDAAKGRKTIKELGSMKKIKNYLDQFLRSENERERSGAYAAALVLGADLSSAKGKMKAFRLAVGADEFEE